MILKPNDPILVISLGLPPTKLTFLAAFPASNITAIFCYHSFGTQSLTCSFWCVYENDMLSLFLFLSLFLSLVFGFDVLLQPSLLSSSSFLIFDLDFLVSFALLLFVFPVVNFLVSCPVFLVINGHLSSSLLFCLDTSSLSLVTLSLTPHLHLSLDLCDISSFRFILSLQTLSPTIIFLSHDHDLQSWSDFPTAICSDCAGVDSDEETQVSFIVVSIICVIFFFVCSCQCWQKFSWELTGIGGKRPMPMAPYDRDVSNV